MASNYYSKNTHTATSSYTGETIDSEHLRTVSIQVQWTGLDVKDGSWQLQVSNDGASWVDKSSKNCVAANGLSEYSEECHQRFVRAYITNGTNTVGTYTVTIMCKV